MANPVQAIDASAQKLGAPAHKSFFYKALLWYTSWFYWAAGVYIGLVLGTFFAIKTYMGTLLVDFFKLFGKKPPTVVAKLAGEKPGPSTVAAAVSGKTGVAGLAAPVVRDTAVRAATTVQTATTQARVAASQAAGTVSTKVSEASKAAAAGVQSFPPAQTGRAA